MRNQGRGEGGRRNIKERLASLPVCQSTGWGRIQDEKISYKLQDASCKKQHIVSSIKYIAKKKKYKNTKSLTLALSP